jgi:predicted Zn-dependent protease
MSEEDEIKLGAEYAEQVEQYMGFSGGAELNAYVDRIGQRLVKHSSRSHLKHEFHVVDMKEPNAFALPGGYIYVSRGLLAIMNSEDELAAVLGHEIGHVAGRHSAKQQTKSRGWIPLQILAGIGGAAASVVSPGLGGAVASMGQLPASLVLASYSRKQEKEADRFGQQYAAAEGWDPAALSDTMDALTREQELAGGRDPSRMSFFDSHPTTPERARGPGLRGDADGRTRQSDRDRSNGVRPAARRSGRRGCRSRGRVRRPPVRTPRARLRADLPERLDVREQPERGYRVSEGRVSRRGAPSGR